VPTGVFGADMQVCLVNDGPVTLCIDSAEPDDGSGIRNQLPAVCRRMNLFDPCHPASDIKLRSIGR
jgi:hypothetical protein